MVMAAELSARAGLIAAADVHRVRSLLRRAGLPITGPALGVERLLELMAIDKKAVGGRVRFVLLDSVGAASLREAVDERLVREAIVAAAQ
jgi:3-dehydroquinate synthase